MIGTRFSAQAGAFLATVVLAACGGGGGGGTPDDEGPPGDGSGGGTPPVAERAVYAADAEVDQRIDLFLVFTAEPGNAARVNPVPVSGGDAGLEPSFSSDGERIVYRGDLATVEQSELWLTEVAAPGAATRLNQALPADGDVRGGVAVIDGPERALYLADADVDDKVELFAVALDNPGVATRVNEGLADDRSVVLFRVAPNGGGIVYTADQDTAGVIEAYLVDPDAPGFSARLHPPLPATADVSGAPRFSPDGTRLTYRADANVDQVFELFMVDLAAPGTAVRLNPALGADQDVFRHRFTPDGAAVVYLADQDTADQRELYRVPVDDPGNAVRLNAPLDPGGAVDDFAVLPDGSGVLYQADPDGGGVAELFLVGFGSPGSAEKVNGATPQGFGISDLGVSPDSRLAYYVADQGSGVRDLFVAELANPGTATRISQDLPASRFGIDHVMGFRPDSQHVAYITDATEDGLAELFLADVTNPGSPARLNGPLVAGGEVINEGEAVTFFPVP